MIRTSSLSEACDELFARYPLAAETDGNGAIRTLLLMLQEGDGGKYFVLSHDRREGRPPYTLRRRRTTDVVDIEAGGGTRVPGMIANAVTHGVPIPRDGSLFAWGGDGVVTALVPFYTTYTPEAPDPYWAVMPRAGVPEARWPPFTDERPFGDWFWSYHRAGKIVSVGELIAGTPGTVFWASTKATLGADSCAVARDIASPGGYTLPRGVYVVCQALRAGKPVPSLEVLLADGARTDLAPRFRRFAHSDGRPQGGA